MEKKNFNELKIKSDNLIAFKKKARQIRRKVLDMAIGAGAGHIGPSFSCVEILVALYYGGFLRTKFKDYKWENRDRFILSKGHAALSLYAILADRGILTLSDLDCFASKGGRISCLPENSTCGIEAFTGSLGHGLSIGAGIAFGAKLNKKNILTAVLLGDGECHEGSVWEAAIFASQHRLGNLVAIIDHNGLSATGILKDYLDIEPLKDKWEAFGWDSIVVDGHSFGEILPALKAALQRRVNKPLVIIALTTKGKGVSFMENNPIWHYRVPKEKEIIIAKKELNK